MNMVIVVIISMFIMFLVILFNFLKWLVSRMIKISVKIIEVDNVMVILKGIKYDSKFVVNNNSVVVLIIDVMVFKFKVMVKYCCFIFKYFC